MAASKTSKITILVLVENLMQTKNTLGKQKFLHLMGPRKSLPTLDKQNIVWKLIWPSIYLITWTFDGSAFMLECTHKYDL